MRKKIFSASTWRRKKRIWFFFMINENSNWLKTRFLFFIIKRKKNSYAKEKIESINIMCHFVYAILHRGNRETCVRRGWLGGIVQSSLALKVSRPSSVAKGNLANLHSKLTLFKWVCIIITRTKEKKRSDSTKNKILICDDGLGKV